LAHILAGEPVATSPGYALEIAAAITGFRPAQEHSLLADDENELIAVAQLSADVPCDHAIHARFGIWHDVEVQARMSRAMSSALRRPALSRSSQENSARVARRNP
jgi:hypothetical protein